MEQPKSSLDSKAGLSNLRQESPPVNQQNGQAPTTLTKDHPPLIQSEHLPPPTYGQGQLEEIAEPSQTLTAREKRLQNKLAAFYGTVGFLLTQVNIYDGVVVIKGSEDRATEVVLVARKHKWLMEFLERMVETNDYVLLTVGHGMMLYAILANHGRIKANESVLAQFGYHPSQLIPQSKEPDAGTPIRKKRASTKRVAASA